MKKVERISPEERSPPDLSNLLHHHARYCLNDPSIRGGGGETRDTVNRWKRLGKQWKLEKLALFFFFIFIFSNGSASLKAQTMLISQRVSSIYKSIPGGCLAGPPFLCVCVYPLCVFFILSSFPLVSQPLPHPKGNFYLAKLYFFRPLDREEPRKQRLCPRRGFQPTDSSRICLSQDR